MTTRCALCGRVTLHPGAWIGAYPVGPTCARRAGLIEIAARRGSHAVTAPGVRKSTAQQDPETLDLFESLE
jgi:hypothetical protein